MSSTENQVSSIVDFLFLGCRMRPAVHRPSFWLKMVSYFSILCHSDVIGGGYGMGGIKHLSLSLTLDFERVSIARVPLHLPLCCL